MFNVCWDLNDNNNGVDMLLNNGEYELKLSTKELLDFKNSIDAALTKINILATTQQCKEDYYRDELREKYSIKKFIKIHTELMEKTLYAPKFVEATDEFLTQFVGYGTKTLNEVMYTLLTGCSDIEEIHALFECDYYTVNNCYDGEKYLCPWYDDDTMRDEIIDNIVGIIKDYNEDELKKFNSIYGLDIKHYYDLEGLD